MCRKERAMEWRDKKQKMRVSREYDVLIQLVLQGRRPDSRGEPTGPARIEASHTKGSIRPRLPYAKSIPGIYLKIWMDIGKSGD